MKTIDFEAHFYTEEYLEALRTHDGYPRFAEDPKLGFQRLWYNPDVGQPFPESLLNKLLDLGEGRVQQMDAFGIEVQVLSLSAPGLEQLDPALATELARRSNDALAEAIRSYPDRFKGFAALSPKHPKEAADELERAVKELGFVGWNTHSNFGGTYLDDRRYRPILERAAELDVPVYLHPTIPAISELRDYGLALAGAAFGFGFETAMGMIRLILSGVFDEFPGLKFILGHLGEALPFLMTRIDWPYLRPFGPEIRPDLARRPSEYLKSNVFVTTSGNHFQPAFMCTYEAMGVDRIILGTDYPYEDLAECTEFLDRLPITEGDRRKVYSENASQLGIGV